MTSMTSSLPSFFDSTGLWQCNLLWWICWP